MNKKFLSVAASAAIVASTLVFTGCGDSGSSSSPSPGSSSSNPPAAGAQTAQFFKGLWAGISYNGTGGVSGTTNSTGHYTYNANGLTDFDLGLFTVRANTTAISNNGVVYAAQTTNLGTGATVTSTEIGNLLGVMSAFGINETSGAAGNANATKVSTILAKLKELKALQPQTYNASSATMNTDTVVTAVVAATGITNTSKAKTAITAYNDYVAAQATQMQAAGSATANLNKTFLANRAIIFTDGTIVAFGGSPIGSGTNVTVTGLSGVSGNFSASGAFINVTGHTNNTGTIALNGALAAGTTATIVKDDGTMVTRTIAAAPYKLWQVFTNQTGAYTDIANYTTYSLAGKAVKFEIANTTAGGGTNGTITVNNVLSGKYVVSNEFLGYAINATNATGNGTNMTIIFEDDPATTTVAKWWEAITTGIADIVSKVLRLFS